MEEYIIEDLGARIAAVSARQELFDSFIHDTQGDAVRLSDRVSAFADVHCADVISNEIKFLRHEVSEIKTAIMDVHDMLRSMGMDDMSRRLGDLNLFLT